MVEVGCSDTEGDHVEGGGQGLAGVMNDLWWEQFFMTSPIPYQWKDYCFSLEGLLFCVSVA